MSIVSPGSALAQLIYVARTPHFMPMAFHSGAWAGDAVAEATYVCQPPRAVAVQKRFQSFPLRALV